MIRSIKQFSVTLLSGLRAMFALPLTPTQLLRPLAHFWWLLLLSIALSVASDLQWVQSPRLFAAEGLQRDALSVLLTLLFATLAAQLAGQRVLTWPLAIHLSTIGLIIGAVAMGIYAAVDAYDAFNPVRFQIWYWWASGWWAIAAMAACHSIMTAIAPWRRALLGLGGALLTTLPMMQLDLARYWTYDFEAAAMLSSATPARRVPGSAEKVWAMQPAQVEHALAKLQRGLPGRVDAYLLALGADGNEDVFRNEAEYVELLMRQRFGMNGRTLRLVNHPDTTAVTPLATLSNVRQAVAGIAAAMDREEDLFFLFATTHGSEDHRLYVDLDPLPLDWIAPQDLREVLDQAGITWRVIIVSACYSGGFIDALKSPTTIVITAARHDRTSFGCGAASEITYFGRAFFVDALNHVADWFVAFESAKDAVAAREKEGGFDPSEPQIDIGALIRPKFLAWSQALEVGRPVAFVPAVAKPCGEGICVDADR